MNGKEIYPLINTKPVVIPLFENNPRIVITDGYHFTVPLKLVYRDLPVCCFKVVCTVSDLQLLIGGIVLAAFYLLGLFSGLVVFKVLSFLPIVYLLLFYYLNRKDFLKLVPVLN